MSSQHTEVQLSEKPFLVLMEIKIQTVPNNYKVIP
jgi:hypothetical protein